MHSNQHTPRQMSIYGPAGLLNVLVRRGDAEGDPVLLIHGARMQAACWNEVMELIDGDPTCIAPDLRGHGRSTRRGPFTVADWVDDCVAVLAELDIDRVHLVGCSVGAAVAVELACRGSVTPLSLTTFGGAFLPAPDSVREAIDNATTDGPTESLKRALRDTVLGPSTTPETFERAVAHISENDSATAQAIDDAANDTDVRPWLTDLHCPAVVVSGDLDQMSPPDEAEWFAREIGAELVWLEGIGHLAMYEAPRETARLIQARLHTR